MVLTKKKLDDSIIKFSPEQLEYLHMYINKMGLEIDKVAEHFKVTIEQLKTQLERLE